MKVLITGFEPFGGDCINSSWETASAISCSEVNGVVIEARKLPVSFSKVSDVLTQHINEVKPDVLIMLGQAKTDFIRIERVAINLMDSQKPDNDGYIPNETPINPDGYPAYFSSLPVKVLRDSLNKIGIHTKVSNSAGLYVCNKAYYTVLHYINLNSLRIKAVFVHLPRISEDFTVERLTVAIQELVISILNN